VTDTRHRSLRFTASTLVCLMATAANAQTDSLLCGSLENAYGPFDYRTASAEQKHLVERAHFTPQVETLRRGSTGAQPGGDIDYTLRVFPNHPRALYAMTRLGKLKETTRPYGAQYPVECYYERAVRFQPNDPYVRALYAIFLIEHRRIDEGRLQLERAEDTASSDPQIAYNLGLAYFQLRDYERSRHFAQQAYAAGISLPALRDMLKRVGEWR